ncbi:PAS domain S-box protein, partial [Roseiflexus sp.]|uniref:PAS domain S-box protein n=1 Tax=Roseiflexus sp. TaxID=2562120 RepID=UPI00398AE7A8
MSAHDLASLIAENEQLRKRIAQLDRFHTIVETTDQLITEVDAEGRFTYVNPASQRFFGYAPEECLGRVSLEFLHPDDRETAQRLFAEWMQHRQRAVMIENRIVHRDGTVFYTLWAITLHYDDAGRIVRATSIAHDIGELHRARSDAQTNREMLQLVIDTLPQAVFWKDREGHYLGGNRQLLLDTGLSSEEDLIGKTDFELPWAAFAEKYRADDMAVMAEGPRLHIEEQVTRNNGAMAWVRTSKAPLTRDGAVMGVLGIYEDITLEKQQAEELHTFKLLVELAPDGIAIADTQLTITYANHALHAMLGYPSLTGMSVASFVYPPDMETLQTIASQVTEGQSLQSVTLRYVRCDGAIITVQASAMALRDQHGNLRGYVSINRDISEQIAAEESLRRSEKHNRALLAAIPDLMFLLSADGTFLDYKGDSSGSLLLPPEAFLGRRVTDVMPPSIADLVMHHIEQLQRTGEIQHFTYQISFGDRIEEYDARMTFSNNDIIVLARNVTEQRRAERERAAMQEQIIQAQQATLRELSTPLLPIADSVVVMPLVGAIDSNRAQQIMETLLFGVAEYNAQIAIIDITGVKVVDTQVAG